MPSVQLISRTSMSIVVAFKNRASRIITLVAAFISKAPRSVTYPPVRAYFKDGYPIGAQTDAIFFNRFFAIDREYCIGLRPDGIAILKICYAQRPFFLSDKYVFEGDNDILKAGTSISFVVPFENFASRICSSFYLQCPTFCNISSVAERGALLIIAAADEIIRNEKFLKETTKDILVRDISWARKFCLCSSSEFSSGCGHQNGWLSFPAKRVVVSGQKGCRFRPKGLSFPAKRVVSEYIQNNGQRC